MELPGDLFERCLSPTDSSTPVRFQTLLVNHAGSLHVEACRIDVEEYERLGRCERELLPSPGPITVSQWGGLDDDRVVTRIEEAFWRITWRGQSFWMVEAEWQLGYNGHSRQWLLTPDRALALEFILEVERATNDPRESILVFHGSCWQRSKELWLETQKATFDDLILARALKDQIRADFRRFLTSRAAYEAHGLPWRRGALFLGPPGNGKTHCLRALVKDLGIPALYVQSVKTRYETEEANLKRVFDRARQLRPCVLILEDLDALVNQENQSFFLNQLDGFDRNVGLVVLATTNHPDAIDPALIDRPSRFDRKYHFDLPELPERAAYLRLWSTRVKEVVWTEETTVTVAERTQGFSFAYLQELVITALMRRVGGDETPWPELLLREQAALEQQLKTRPARATSLRVGDVDPD